MRYLSLAVLLSALTVACGGGSPTSPSNASGNFKLMLTDSPYGDAKSVLITFNSVSAHRDTDNGFTTLGTGTRTCDLKKLQGPQDILGIGTLSAGHYTQVRLVVASATIYYDNASTGNACAASIAAPAGRSASLDIPSGELKLNREFDVSANGVTTMVIDFDGDKSIHETGNGRIMMSPVVGVVSVQ